MSHSLTCPFSRPALPALPALPLVRIPVVLSGVVLHLRPLSPDVLNYFIRYYSPPTTTPTVLTPSGTQAGIPLHFVQPYCRRVKADCLGYILFPDYLKRIAWDGAWDFAKLSGPDSRSYEIIRADCDEKHR